MLPKTYQEGDKPKCPHCDEQQENLVQDMTVPNRFGQESRSEEQCEVCDLFFTVERVVEGEYRVEAVEADEDEE